MPFPQVSSVNAYLIKGDHNILVDAGLGTREAWQATKERLSSLGLSPGDIRHIYLTHGHLDHYGLAQKIVEKSGARVHIHRKDEEKVTGDLHKTFESYSRRYRDFFSTMGVPEDIVSYMTTLFQGSLSLARQVARVERVEEGERLPLNDREIIALCFPGHTPGMVCYYDRSHRILFSGDHLLLKISPNPVLELDQDGIGGKFKGLVEYLRSLTKVESLDIDLVLPGHGEIVHNHRELIAGLRQFYKRRQGRILKALKNRPMTPYQVVKAIFPRLKEFDIFLAVSEVIGNLEVIEEEGAITAERMSGTGVAYYRAV